MDLYVYNLNEYSSDTRQGNEYTPIWPFRLAVAAIYVAQRFFAIPKAILIRENVNYISLHGGHSSLSDTKRIIRQYTNESDSLAPIIDELTLSREFIVFDLRHPKTDLLSIRV
ncbi:hypothetical protein RclHR1_39530002 [Rhizophagus clarus]|uniref:Uncharacterized protein n=1 Tax=Rhizophagus clarus TaxID=94130 RepID=A0A2Z6RFM0_9GLOM|nr:hypothetical protein RclHR1_39530002 [Rhizophagus clarus]